MLKLLLLILPIALIDSVSPVRIGTMIALLGERRPWPGAFAFLAGVFFSYYLLGVIVALGADNIIDFLTAEPHPIEYGAGIAIGALLVVLGARNFRAKPMPSEIKEPRGRGPGGALFLGLVLTLVTAPAALPYLAGIDLILQSGFGEPEMFAALAFYCTLYVASLLALMALRSVLGPRSAALLFQVNRIVSTWMPRVVAVLLLILGALMIADGVTYFFGYPLFPTGPAP